MPLRIIWWTPKTEMRAYLPAIQRITDSVMPNNLHHEIDGH